MIFYDHNLESTDITVGTKAEQMWRFLRETTSEIYDLKAKQKLFAEAYLTEMRHARIPYFFDGQWLANARDKEMGKKFGNELLGNMFGEDFVKENGLEFVKIVGYNSYVFEMSHGYYIRFDCNGIKYEFFTPCPRNIKIDDTESLMPICFTAFYCTDIGDTCLSWKQIPGSGKNGYDWQAVCDSIKAYIVKRTEENSVDCSVGNK